MPRKAVFEDLPSLARVHTKTCVKTLAGIVKQPKAPHAARIAAAAILLDRGWGKPAQAVTVGGEASIKVVIRHILEGLDGEATDAEPKLIEGELAAATENEPSPSRNDTDDER